MVEHLPGDKCMLSDSERVVDTDTEKALAELIRICLKHDISFTIAFDTGRSIPGQRLYTSEGKIKKDNEITPDDIIQDIQGFTFEIAGMTYTDNKGNEIKYRSLYEGVMDATNMVAIVLFNR